VAHPDRAAGHVHHRLSAKRYRSAPIIIAVHSAQSVVLLGPTLSLVLEG
jgi:hypothetical protein